MATGDPPPHQLAPPPPRRRQRRPLPAGIRFILPGYSETYPPIIVTLKGVTMENHEPFFIFENMVCNLYDVRRELQVAFPEGDIRNCIIRILQGLADMHNNGYFQRDLKPENLLVTNGIVQTAGFGLAREVSSNPPSIRWYSAPEVLLRSSAYTHATGMWTVGAILAEFFTLSPLFPGESETDQLYKICTVLGTPDCTISLEGMNLPHSCSFNFFQILPRNLWEPIPNASLEAIDSIQLCSWDPRRRPTAEQASQHPFFNVCKPRPADDASHTKTNEPKAEPRLEPNPWDFSTEPNDCFLDFTLSLKPSFPGTCFANPVPRRTEEEILLYSAFENTPVKSAGSNPSSSWSDLLEDLVLSILQHLQLPEAIAFASVCTSWRSAATAAGVPRSCAPMIMSWRDILGGIEAGRAKGSSSVNCKFLHLLDVHKAYDVRFPQDLHFVACCGSSHGWLILVNELANLVLYNPFTSEMTPLPPITDFACIEAVRDSEGNIEAYHFENRQLQDTKYVATWFYQKAVLSCSPSKYANYIVMIIHRDSNWLSFVRAGESSWQVAATLVAREADRYADCAYHNGMFYTVTFQGIVEKWDLDGSNGPAKEVIVAKRSSSRILTRHLVSTPWGDLLEVRAGVSTPASTSSSAPMGECSTEYRGLPDGNGVADGAASVPASLRKVSILPLVFLSFYEVSGGPFGIEDSVGAAGPLLAIAGFLVLPVIWSIPEALLTAELGTMFPENGGYVVWVASALGPYWGFQQGWMKWLSCVIDNALYPVLFLDYLKSAVPALGGGPPRVGVVLGLTAVLTLLNYRGLTVVGWVAICLGCSLSCCSSSRGSSRSPRSGRRGGLSTVVDLHDVDWNLYGCTSTRCSGTSTTGTRSARCSARCRTPARRCPRRSSTR